MKVLVEGSLREQEPQLPSEKELTVRLGVSAKGE